jgi:hypothetical protein
MVIKSIAEGGKNWYLPARYTVNAGSLHLQIEGQKGNIEYGYNTIIKVPEELLDTIFKTILYGARVRALGTDNSGYVLCQVTAYNDAVLHFQVVCSSPINRPYGAAFNLRDEDAWRYVQANINASLIFDEVEDTEEEEKEEEKHEGKKENLLGAVDSMADAVEALRRFVESL